MRRGAGAVPETRRGLSHPVARVREECRRLLDQLLVPEAVDDLVALERARDADTSPVVRNKAAWNTPAGPFTAVPRRSPCVRPGRDLYEALSPRPANAVTISLEAAPDCPCEDRSRCTRVTECV